MCIRDRSIPADGWSASSNHFNGFMVVMDVTRMGWPHRQFSQPNLELRCVVCFCHSMKEQATNSQLASSSSCFVDSSRRASSDTRTVALTRSSGIGVTRREGGRFEEEAADRRKRKVLKEVGPSMPGLAHGRRRQGPRPVAKPSRNKRNIVAASRESNVVSERLQYRSQEGQDIRSDGRYTTR